jgi:predicted adenylyl cyclase CyaB
MSTGATHEREVKIAVADSAAAARALEAAGAEALGGQLLEDDVLFDDVSRSLAARDHVLRLRVQSDHEGRVVRCALTFKGPAHVDGGARVREEIEIDVGDPHRARLLLDRLGLRPVFRYQKRRRAYRLGGAVVALDDTPVGCYLEIEADAPTLDAVAARLGHSPTAYVTASYPQLWLERHGDRAGDMLLPGAGP